MKYRTSIVSEVIKNKTHSNKKYAFVTALIMSIVIGIFSGIGASLTNRKR